MKFLLLDLLYSEFCLRLTKCLLHFLWQGVAIALCGLLLVALLRTAKAEVRYLIHCVSFSALALCMPITFVLTAPQEPLRVEKFQQPGAELLGANSPNSSSAASTGTDPSTAGPGLSAAHSRDGTIHSIAAAEFGSAATNQTSSHRNVKSRLEASVQWLAPYLVSGYLIGVIAMLGRLYCAVWGGHRLRSFTTPIRDSDLLLRIQSQARRIGLKIVPVVAYSERVTIPIVVGVVRPMILLPLWIATNLNPDQLLVVLTHEMAHIRRFDLLVNLVQRILETILFFHPAVWHISRQMSSERENCCDDAVIRAGHDNLLYASTLVRLAELCAIHDQSGSSSLLTVAVNGTNGSQLKRRILRLLSGQPRLRLTLSDSVLLALMAGLTLATASGLWQTAIARSPLDADKSTAASPVMEQRPADPEDVIDVTGRIFDSAGAPISHAFVFLGVSRSHELTWQGPKKLATSESTEDGHFRFSMSASEIEKYGSSERTSFEIWVHQPGFTLAMHQSLRVLPSGPVELRLEPETPFEITLRDPKENPCGGAKVAPVTATFGAETWLSLPHPIRQRLETECDENGRAQVKGLNLSQIRNLKFSHPDYGDQNYYSRQGLPIKTDLTLMPVGALRGKLKIPQAPGVDLTRIRLRVATLDFTAHGVDEYWSGNAEITPDKNGQFFIPHILANRVRVFFVIPDDFPYRPDSSPTVIIVKAEQTVDLQIPMRQVIPVTQLLRNAETKQPLKHVEVHYQHQHLVTIARSDNNGLVTAMLLPGAQYHRYVDVPSDYVLNSGGLSLRDDLVTPQDANRLELEPGELRPGRMVRGTVLDGNLKPFAGATVKAVWTVPDPAVARTPNSKGVAYGTTDHHGRFEISRIDRHVELTLTPMLGGLELGSGIPLDADDDRVVILKTRPFELTFVRGRVIDSEGEPVAGAIVRITGRRQGKRYGVCQIYAGIDGCFETPPHLAMGDDFQITVLGNGNDTSSDWHRLAQANQTLPDFAVDRKALGLRGHIARSPGIK